MHEGSSFHDFKILDSALDRFAPSDLVSADGVLALEELRSEARAAGDWEKVAAQEYAGVQYFDFDVNEAIRRWSERAKAHAMVLEGLSRQSE